MCPSIQLLAEKGMGRVRYEPAEDSAGRERFLGVFEAGTRTRAGDVSRNKARFAGSLAFASLLQVMHSSDFWSNVFA